MSMTDKVRQATVHGCVRRGDLDKLTTLLNAGWSPDGQNEFQWTPLCRACWHGHTDIVDVLINHGANVHSSDNNGWTSLHNSAWQGHTQIIKVLVSNGAAVHVKDNNGWTPLHNSAWKGYSDIVKDLINYGADVTVTDIHGQTPLHKSACQGHTEIVEVLVKNGADVNVEDRARETPLHGSACRGHKKIVGVLISHGADVNVREILSGRTPLHESARRGHKEIVEVLLLYGADVNVHDTYGWTPLLKSTDQGHRDIVEALISHGADVNVKNAYKDTPLHKSAQRGFKDMVKLLIKHGADIDPVNVWDDTPLKLAERRGHKDIVSILRQAKPVQNGDSRIRKVIAGFFGYSSSTKKIRVKSSGTSGQVTEVSCESSEVTSQATGICETVEFGPGREQDISKVKTNTTIEVETCKQGGLSSAPSTLQTSASSNILATPTTSLSPATSALAATTASSSPPNTEPTDEIILHAQSLLEAVKRKRKSDEDGGRVCQDQDSLKLLSDQLDGNVIVINNKTVNNHYHNTYYNNNNQQVSCEEVKVETSQMLDVSVAGTTQYTLLNTPQTVDHVKGDEDDDIHGEVEVGKMVGQGRNGQTSNTQHLDADIHCVPPTQSLVARLEERETTSVSLSNTSTMACTTALATTTATSPSSLATSMKSSSLTSSTTSCTSVAEIRRRVQSLSQPVEKMFQTCMTGGEVGHNQTPDLPVHQHGNPQVKVSLKVFVQPREVNVYNTKQVKCQTAQVENAEMVPVNSRCNFNYAAPPASDDEDNDDSTGDENDEEHEVHMEDTSK